MERSDARHKAKKVNITYYINDIKFGLFPNR